jgi:hypothetical protein
MARPELALAAARPIARGVRRLVYRDPRNERRAVKVTIAGRTGPDRKSLPQDLQSLKRVDFSDETRRLWREHCDLMKRLGQPWPRHLAACYGLDATDAGAGLVVELVANADGSPPPSLAQHLRRHGLDARCRRALKELRRFLLRRRVILAAPRLDNILLREEKDGTLTAVIVDGVDVPATTRRISFCRKRHAARVWRELLAAVKELSRSRKKA